MPAPVKFALWILAAALCAAAALGLRRCSGPAPEPSAAAAAPAATETPAVSTVPAQAEFRVEIQVPPDVLLISTSRSRAAYLLQQLYKSRPDARGRPFEVIEASAADAERIAAELRRVPQRKIKFVGIDGDLWEPNDPVISPEMKKLTSSGIFTLGIEFVE